MSTPWIVQDADLDDVHSLAAFLALALKPGDVIALSGELGAGKTTFARDVIRAVLQDESQEIPSPTFSLVQSYDGGRLPLAHFDCYRMGSAGELQEVGLDDALRSGAALIEWGERVEEALPSGRLEISFGDGSRDDTRTLTLAGHGEWQERAQRLKELMDFCAGSPWARARPVFLQGDASTRAYARLRRNGDTAILMDSPARPDGPPVRGGKAYSQLVHLAEDVRPFVAVDTALKKAGLSVPSILAKDLSRGFLIIEDLGDRVFSNEAGKSPSLEEMYRAAVDVLLELMKHKPGPELPLPGGGAHRLAEFTPEVMQTEAELLLEWFYPAVHGDVPAKDIRDEFLHAFQDLFETIAGRDDGWVLRDYHSPNLLWLPHREGTARVGVIDFQDALRGHAAYDLVSLLQDARCDIADELEGRLYAHYCEARGGADSQFDADGFSTAYAALGAQRNAKILGIFARLAKRDAKHGYLAHIPRVSAYLERDLRHPALARLRAWFDNHLPGTVRGKPLAL